MGVKFTQGDSVATTRTTARQNPPSNVPGNTMNGMPGHIKAGQTTASGSMKGGMAFSPKKNGPIGQKGGSGARMMGKASPGTTTKNYKSASTGSAGTLKGNGGKMEKLKARTSAEGGRKSWSY